MRPSISPRGSSKVDLDWLWDMRNRQHLFELDSSEFEFYQRGDHGRAVRAVNALITALPA